MSEQTENGLSLDEIIEDDVQSDETPPEYDFVSLAEWPDEEKPKVENEYRRRRPLGGAWVELGNDELWLIPEIDSLGMDIEIYEKRGMFGKLSLTFSASYKQYRQLRELFAKVLMDQTETGIRMEWEDAYCLMYLALRVNYKISSDEVNRLGLLRQEHCRDILAALAGAVKKKESSAGYGLPLPFTAGVHGSPD